jgi:hypothetical protein
MLFEINSFKSEDLTDLQHHIRQKTSFPPCLSQSGFASTRLPYYRNSVLTDRSTDVSAEPTSSGMVACSYVGHAIAHYNTAPGPHSARSSMSSETQQSRASRQAAALDIIADPTHREVPIAKVDTLNTAIGALEVVSIICGMLPIIGKDLELAAKLACKICEQIQVHLTSHPRPTDVTESGDRLSRRVARATSSSA